MPWHTQIYPLPSRGGGLGGGGDSLAVETLKYRVDHTFYVRQHICIPKAQNAETLRSQKAVSLLVIANGDCMLATIDFHDKLAFDTDEMRDVWCWRRNL